MLNPKDINNGECAEDIINKIQDGMYPSSYVRKETKHMSKNFWECEPKFNDKGSNVYNDDCVVTIVELGQVTEGNYRDFQAIGVKGPTGDKVGISFSYAKDDPKLTPDQMNKEFECRFKVETDQSEYAFNGRKYTAAWPYKKKAGSGGGGGYGGKKSGSGWQKATPEEILGKCCTLLFCAEVQRVGLETLNNNEAAKSAGIRLAKDLIALSEPQSDS